MIECWTGTPGSGKSASVLVYALNHIDQGGVVLANFSLVDGWSNIMAKTYPRSWFSESAFLKTSQTLYNRWWTFGDLSDVWKFVDIYPKYLGKKMAQAFESKCLILIDEAQLVFNSRAWQKNMEWIEFFSQHRKLGFDILLVTHSEDMIDCQIRNYLEYVVKMRNLYRIRVPFVQIPLSYFFLCRNLFCAKWYYYGVGVMSGSCFKTRFLPLRKWAASLYSSLSVFRMAQGSGLQGLQRCGPGPRGIRAASDKMACPILRAHLVEMAQELKRTSSTEPA